MNDEQLHANAAGGVGPDAFERPFTVVVGVTFDEAGALALRESLRAAAHRPHAVIHAVHVVKGADGLRKTRPAGRLADKLALDGDQLFRFVYELVQREPVIADERLRLHTLVGTPAEALMQHTVDAQADLLVVGTHGHSGLAALVLGATGQDLVRRARCPVLVARPRNYEGLERSPSVEPLCADCADMRAATDGAVLWCEWHARPHVHAQPFGGAAAGHGDHGGLPYQDGFKRGGR